MIRLNHQLIFSVFLCLGSVVAQTAFSGPLSEEITLSNESGQTIRFQKNTRVEIEILGKLKNNNEVYLDAEKLPTKQGQFKAVVNLYPLQEKYTLKIKRPGISETLYPFTVKLIKPFPLPLRVKIESPQSKPIAKEKIFTGSYPSQDWIQITWLESAEKIDPAYLEKLEREKQERARLEAEKIEKERLEKEKFEEQQRQLAKLEQERLERERQEQERLAKEREEKERFLQEQQELARIEQERLAEEMREKQKAEADRQEKEKKRFAKLEEERLEKEKEERERFERVQQELARVERERVESERKEKERMEAERQERERKRIGKLEEERLKKEREAKEKEEARLAEVQAKKERDLASQIEKSNELTQKPQYREPIGIWINQGLGAFSLKQTGSDLNSLNWMVNLSYQTAIQERMKLGFYGQGFLIPLSVTGATKGPNVIKLGVNLGYDLKNDSGAEWTPQLGVSYQTMVTSDSFGYRDLAGPNLGISLKLPLGSEIYCLQSTLSMAIFPTSEQLLGFGNNELHFKSALQWKVSSSFVSGLSLGVDFSSLNLAIAGTKLTSSGYSLFFGLNF